MFWKKPSEKSVKLDLGSRDQREAYRVDTDAETVVLCFPDEEVNVLNISAGGLTFIKVGMQSAMTAVAVLVLPRVKRIEVNIEVLRIDADGVAYGRFVRLTETEKDAIHYYVLCRQKAVMGQQQSLQDLSEYDVDDVNL